MSSKEGKDAKALSSASAQQLPAPAEPAQSANLSKDLALQLMTLIKDVNKDAVTPESVNASCNAAAQIYKLLKLNFDMKRDGF